MRIVIIDDSKFQLDFLKETLQDLINKNIVLHLSTDLIKTHICKKCGHQQFQGSRCNECKHHNVSLNMQLKHADLIILDNKIGNIFGITGLDYAKSLRKMGFEIPILFISSDYTSKQDIYDVNPIENSQWLPKPFTLKQIRSLINQAKTGYRQPQLTNSSSRNLVWAF